MAALKERKAKVYMFVLDTTASAYYRIVQPFKYFQKQKREGFDFHLASTFHPQYFAEGDIFVFQRFADKSLFELLMFLKNQGKRVIFDIDYYPEPPVHHPLFGLIYSLRPFLQLFMSNVNCLITPTQQLKEELSAYNERVFSIPNFIFNQYWRDVSKANAKRKLGLPKKAVVLGWVGHPMNYHSLRQISRVLEDLSAKFDNLYFVFFDKDPQFISLPPERKIVREFKAYPSYLEYLDFIDIGLAPLANTLFNGCKFPSLVLEYGMKKIPTVVSNVGSLVRLKEEGAPIFVAKKKDEWIKILTELIQDSVFRKKQGRALYDFVNKHYQLEKKAYMYWEVFEEVMKR